MNLIWSQMSTKLTARKRYLPRVKAGVTEFKKLSQVLISFARHQFAFHQYLSHPILILILFFILSSSISNWFLIPIISTAIWQVFLIFFLNFLVSVFFRNISNMLFSRWMPRHWLVFTQTPWVLSVPWIYTGSVCERVKRPMKSQEKVWPKCWFCFIHSIINIWPDLLFI